GEVVRGGRERIQKVSYLRFARVAHVHSHFRENGGERREGEREDTVVSRSDCSGSAGLVRAPKSRCRSSAALLCARRLSLRPTPHRGRPDRNGNIEGGGRARLFASKQIIRGRDHRAVERAGGRRGHVWGFDRNHIER